jgi:hypothetical protein
MEWAAGARVAVSSGLLTPAVPNTSAAMTRLLGADNATNLADSSCDISIEILRVSNPSAAVAACSSHNFPSIAATTSGDRRFGQRHRRT